MIEKTLSSVYMVFPSGSDFRVTTNKVWEYLSSVDDI